jgi:hypothetical protein
MRMLVKQTRRIFKKIVRIGADRTKNGKAIKSLIGLDIWYWSIEIDQYIPTPEHVSRLHLIEVKLSLRILKKLKQVRTNKTMRSRQKIGEKEI